MTAALAPVIAHPFITAATVATAAATKKAMDVKPPSVPAPPPAPKPQELIEEAKAKAKKRALASKRRKSTILTGGSLGVPDISRPTLLGG